MQQINIRNEETYRLVQQLTDLTGENMTQAIRRSVRERLEDIRIKTKKSRAGIAEDLLAIGRECAALPVLDDRHPDDILYDENGLPK